MVGMKRLLLGIMMLLAVSCGSGQQGGGYRDANYAKNGPRFKALLFYSDHEESAHVQFAHQGIAFFRKLTVGDGFQVDSTQTLDGYTLEQLQEYNVIVALNAYPSREARPLFEQYMDNGGGWVGFHAAGYNDPSTGWP